MIPIFHLLNSDILPIFFLLKIIKTYFIKFSENYNPFCEKIEIFFTILILQIIWDLILLFIKNLINDKKD